jgi:hypothetical protein
VIKNENDRQEAARVERHMANVRRYANQFVGLRDVKFQELLLAIKDQEERAKHPDEDNMTLGVDLKDLER